MFRGVGVRGHSGIGEGGGGFSLPGCFLKVMVLLSRLGLFIYSLTKGHHFRVLCQKKNLSECSRILILGSIRRTSYV